jgi:hypothetical protein
LHPSVDRRPGLIAQVLSLHTTVFFYPSYWTTRAFSRFSMSMFGWVVLCTHTHDMCLFINDQIILFENMTSSPQHGPIQSPFDWRLKRLLYLCLWADEVRERPFLYVLGLQGRFGAVAWRSESGWVGVCVYVCV